MNPYCRFTLALVPVGCLRGLLAGALCIWAAAAVWERVRSYSAGSRISKTAWPRARMPRAGRGIPPIAGLARRWAGRPRSTPASVACESSMKYIRPGMSDPCWPLGIVPDSRNWPMPSALANAQREHVTGVEGQCENAPAFDVLVAGPRGVPSHRWKV
jgi:hypothetical protein